MIVPESEFTFEGCRTAAEAEDRFRKFLEQKCFDDLLKCPPHVLEDEDAVAFIAERDAQAIAEAMQQFRQILSMLTAPTLH